MKTTHSISTMRFLCGVLALTAMLASAGCSADRIVEAETPDIILPEDVQSAAGAEAVRVGALTRLNLATSGDESLFLLGGLFSDEFNNGDSFIARQEIDQRVVTSANNFLTSANRVLHRARVAAEQGVDLIAKFNPAAPGWHRAEMYFVQAFTINLLAEHYCDGLVLSTLVEGREELAEPMTTVAAYERALAKADTGLTLITGTTTNDVRVQNALRVTRGRILNNLNRRSDASAAVAAVPTTYQYVMLHSANTQSNNIWLFNNNARRYSVSDREGTNGLNFATAADPRVPVCRGNDTQCRAIGVTQSVRDDLTQPLFVQMLWPARESAVVIISGREARLIEAEAQLAAGNSTGALATLNALRTGVTGLAALTDAGTSAGRVDQLFRERAFWLFARGHRTGDLRRLIRQYGRAQNTVFPTGAWHKGGNYGADMNFPVPFAEANNPAVDANNTCINRTA